MQQTITKKNWAKSNPQFLSALIVVLVLATASVLVSGHKLILNICTLLSLIWMFKSLKGIKTVLTETNTPEGFPKSAQWPGLGREPKWEGTISPVTDYVKPRYVYSDGAESETPMQNHGRVIGYRIAPELVIHSQVGYGGGWGEQHIGAFMDCFGGKLLNRKETSVLRENWETISAMRQKIGDAPLPKPFFWRVDKHGYAVATDWNEEILDYMPHECAIILKR